MRALGDRWETEVLDETLVRGTYRVAVQLWVPIAPIADLYFVRPRDWRLVWNYFREIGPTATLRKVMSRRRERLRNDKYIAAGVGTIHEADTASPLGPGAQVVFVAPCHARVVDRLVLDSRLARRVSAPFDLRRDEVWLADDAAESVVPVPAPLPAWSPYTGRALDGSQVDEFLTRVEGHCRLALDRPPTARLPASTAIRETSSVPVGEERRPGTAVLFGYGNYAKTTLLPAVGRHLTVTRIHELDPLQIGPSPDPAVVWDTSPVPRPGGSFDAWFIAGYHHTHAPLAVAALEAGAAAVVEKPVATTHDDLDRLVAACRATGQSMFAAYQRRYARYTEWARADLEVSAGDPVSYFAIAYEVPLPARHWYRWPNSRSRIVSNGCHWIDHFLHLNEYADVIRHNVTCGRNEDVSIVAELANGALFSLMLTSQGSARRGMVNHIELRARDRTVRIVDDSSYTAEDGRRVLRRRRSNRLDAYARMYAEISRRVSAGLPGDSLPSIERSARLVLDLDAQLVSALASLPT